MVAGALAQAPPVSVSVVSAPPVVGAALLALDLLGTASVAEPATREAMGARVPRAVAASSTPAPATGSWLTASHPTHNGRPVSAS